MGTLYTTPVVEVLADLFARNGKASIADAALEIRKRDQDHALNTEAENAAFLVLRELEGKAPGHVRILPATEMELRLVADAAEPDGPWTEWNAAERDAYDRILWELVDGPMRRVETYYTL